MEFVKEGLVDQLIVNRESRGLGLGTKDLFAACASKYAFYLQNDQYLCRDFTQNEMDFLAVLFGALVETGGSVVTSISLAGSPCGEGVYSERGHLILTEQYQMWERQGLLGHYGAGRFHDGEWREASIQRLYAAHKHTHLEHKPALVQDNGVFAVRDMGDAGVWCHRTDTKQLWVIVPPAVMNPVYPKLNDAEFAIAWRGEWLDGRIPEIEVKDSFRCWDHTLLARMQDDYIKDLRRRFAEKRKAR